MGAAGPRWEVVDELIHELGSLRAVIQNIEVAEPDLADDDVTVELRACLARAADTIHLVIGGDAGGRIMATGTPEEVVAVPASHTGRFLADLLPKANGRRRAAR